MSRQAMLPCFVCGKELENVVDDVVNQPHEADCFHTYGVYGSTDFDPMNGEFLEINICTDCMKKGAEQNRILLARDTKPVCIIHPEFGLRTVVGTTKAHREPVFWSPEMETDDSDLLIETWDEWVMLRDSITSDKDDYVKQLFGVEDETRT